MRTVEVTRGVHLVQHANVNCWLIEGDDGLTLVDAGLPGLWRPLGEAIRALGHRPEDIRALVLTHAHFDHVGVAKRLVERLALPVHAHAEEATLARHPYRYAHENPRALYPIRHPRAFPVLASMLWAGAARVRGVTPTVRIRPGEALDVPGRPIALFTPGHTFGHVALHLPDRGAVITGDALVTLDPYTGRTGPRIVAGAATADSQMALESLDVLAETGAALVLPGHGEPWAAGVERAVSLAREHGPA